MKPDVKAYRLAVRRTEEARAQFLADLASAKRSVSPKKLRAEVRAAARERARMAAMGARRGIGRHGWSIAAVVAAIAAWHFRRPLGALSQRLWVKTGKLWQAFKDRRHDHDGQSAQKEGGWKPHWPQWREEQ